MLIVCPLNFVQENDNCIPFNRSITNIAFKNFNDRHLCQHRIIVILWYKDTTIKLDKKLKIIFQCIDHCKHYRKNIFIYSEPCIQYPEYNSFYPLTIFSLKKLKSKTDLENLSKTLVFQTLTINVLFTDEIVGLKIPSELSTILTTFKAGEKLHYSGTEIRNFLFLKDLFQFIFENSIPNHVTGTSILAIPISEQVDVRFIIETYKSLSTIPTLKHAIFSNESTHPLKGKLSTNLLFPVKITNLQTVLKHINI